MLWNLCLWSHLGFGTTTSWLGLGKYNAIALDSCSGFHKQYCRYPNLSSKISPLNCLAISSEISYAVMLTNVGAVCQSYHVVWLGSPLACNPTTMPSTSQYDSLVINIACECDMTHFVGCQWCTHRSVKCTNDENKIRYKSGLRQPKPISWKWHEQPQKTYWLPQMTCFFSQFVLHFVTNYHFSPCNICGHRGIALKHISVSLQVLTNAFVFSILRFSATLTKRGWILSNVTGYIWMR